MKSFDTKEYSSQRGSMLELKSYLQSTHLKIGSYSNNTGGQLLGMSANRQASIDGLMTKSNAFSNQQKTQKPGTTVRTSSDIVLGRGKTDFETSNKGNYTWIQPKMAL